MKVAYDPQIFCLQKYGGVSRYFCEIASIISKINVAQVSIIAPLNVCEYLPYLPKGLVFGFKKPKFQLFGNIQRLAGIAIGHLYLLVLNPKIIHETYFFPYPLGRRSAKRVLTVYDMIHEKYPENNSERDKTTKYKASAVNRADHIICISEATKKDLIELFHVDTNKISVIYLGYKVKKPDLVGISQIRSKLPSSFLLYVGQRGGHKNFKGLMEAYSSSKKIQAESDIVCFGGDVFSSEEIQMFMDLKIPRSKITHLSGGDDVLNFLYQKAAAFIYPSLYEGFGIPPLEAMGNDCPVICSRAGSIPEVVGIAGEYFNPTEIEDIKIAIEKVLFDADRRMELVHFGRLQVKRFCWDRCAKETFELYLKLVSNKHALNTYN